MSALFLALLLGFVVEGGGRLPMLFIALQRRFRAPIAVGAGMALGLGANAAIAAAVGASVAPLLTPEARRLMVALALGLAGGGLLLPVRAPDSLGGWRIGALPTAALGLFILGFGESGVFVTGTIAAAWESPWMAGTGGALGGIGACAILAILAGEGCDMTADGRRTTFRLIRALAGVALLLAAFVLAVQALRLV